MLDEMTPSDMQVEVEDLKYKKVMLPRVQQSDIEPIAKKLKFQLYIQHLAQS